MVHERQKSIHLIIPRDTDAAERESGGEKDKKMKNPQTFTELLPNTIMGVGVIINNVLIISLHFEPLAELMEFSLGSQHAGCLIHSYVFSGDTPQYIIIMAPKQGTLAWHWRWKFITRKDNTKFVQKDICNSSSTPEQLETTQLRRSAVLRKW